MSAGHVGGTRGPGIVSSAADVPWIGEAGEVCEMCRCLDRGDVGGEWMRGLGLGFTNIVRTGGVFDGCLSCGGVCGVGGELIGGCDQGLVRLGGVIFV